MKINFNKILRYFSIAAMLSLAAACGLDNYDEPQSRLHGQIVYKGKPLGLRSTSGAIQLQIYQDGYAKKDPIPVFVNQDGEFSAQLFKGDYKLVTRDGNGPWVNSRDTLKVHVDGMTECKLEVTPYFLFESYNITLDKDEIKASAQIERIVPESEIEKVILVVGKTRFVDESTNLTQKRIMPTSELSAETSLALSSIKDYKDSMHLFARIGVRANGADQYLFTPVIELK